MADSDFGILTTLHEKLKITGRTLEIILELLLPDEEGTIMQEEINVADKGQVQISWKGRALRIALSKYREKSRRLVK